MASSGCGKPGDAARALADAFTIQDPRTSDADRARDRADMGELYRKAKGSEAGLGDLVLQAYDRNLALVQGPRLAAARQRSERAAHGSDAVHAQPRSTAQKLEHGDPEGQSRGVRFLGDVVRALPRAASRFTKR